MQFIPPDPEVLKMQAVQNAEDGFTEIVTVDVSISSIEENIPGGSGKVFFYFTGEADSEYFKGSVQPGAVDTWVIENDEVQSCCASYDIKGLDNSGAECTIHIDNRSKDGNSWYPELKTDSAALSFLNGTGCRTLYEGRETGPIIHIYARI